ncbi:MAG: heavy metal translocating P-type ATPase [bacterium]|nr:heavy metal translocating P-type ATPase [bacterium]
MLEPAGSSETSVDVTPEVKASLRTESREAPATGQGRSDSASDQHRSAAADSGPSVDSEQTLPCIHCGEPTPSASDTAANQVFCCPGCRAAYHLIQGWGLGDFYALRDQAKLTGAARAAGQSERFEQFESPEYLGPSTPRVRNDGTCSTELAVHGLHCGACSWLIENASLRKPGILSARIKMSEHTFQLIYDPQRIKLSEIARLMDSLGYQLAPYDASQENHIHLENRRLLIQIAIAGFLAANAMWIAIALYAGEFTGVAADHRYFLGLMGTALGIAAVMGPGRTFFTGALAALRTWTPHMDLPVALGLSVGAAVGLWNAFRGSGHVYFDSLATLVFFLLIGRWIQFRQQRRAARAVDLMLRITPQHATLVREGQTRQVMVDSLMPGDEILVAPGESVAADGEIVSGETAVDRSLLTGESVPIQAKPGSQVCAGMVNLKSPVQVRVSATGDASRIGKVMQSVEAASAEKTPIVMLADKVGGYFVITVTVLATITFLLWLRYADLSTATSHATALLIVACPCALALATPLAVAVGLGRAARAGILIRDGSAFQQLSKPGYVWFDKTGTLTEGRQRVTSLVGSEQGLRLAAAVEEHCVHPIGQAITREAARRGLEPVGDGQLEQLVTGGILGIAEEHAIAVGNRQLMQAQGIYIPPDISAAAETFLGQGETPIYIAVDGAVVSLVGLADPLRENAKSVINRLKNLGWQVGILSGDHPSITRLVGQQLGLPEDQCFGGLSPEEKLQSIHRSRAQFKQVAMVGDGANDAAALAAADTGIAVRGGAEVSLQAAPVFIATGKLSSLVQLFRGSSQTTRVIYITFAVSLAYNMIAVAFAMAGLISPLVAAVLMPISSVSVMAVTLASRSFEELNL